MLSLEFKTYQLRPKSDYYQDCVMYTDGLFRYLSCALRAVLNVVKRSDEFVPVDDFR